MTAHEVLAALLDGGTFRSWDSAPAGARVDAGYAAELERARARTGVDESVVTGEGRVGGRRVAVAASEFGFLGGSIGVAAGERLTRAVERATAERLPLIVLPASGGTRMQEGTVAFLQMVKITGAVMAHRAARLPYVVYLRHPSTGGVFASWASLGHLTLAEPGALIGFLGPRVYEALEGRPFPAGVQTAENLAAHGLVDAVVPPDQQGGVVARVLDALTAAEEIGGAGGIIAGEAGGIAASGAGGAGGAGEAGGTAAQAAAREPPDVWAAVQRTRQPDYPDARELMAAAVTDVVSVRDGSVVLALGRIGGRPVVIVAQDRHGPPPGPDALRVARRGIRLANDLGLPLVTVIDTTGGELSVAAEEGGLARQIARTLAELLTTVSPTVSVLLGQGTGGAALALLPADRTVAAVDAWLAPLAPEGASAIVYRDTAHAAELARHQGISAADLAAAGAVDQVVSLGDLPGAIAAAVADVAAGDERTRLAARARRYRRLPQ